MSAVFVLEPSDETIQGHPAFYLKNEQNGLYYTYPIEELYLDETNMSAEVILTYTSDQAAAAPFAFILMSDSTLQGDDSYMGSSEPEDNSILITTRVKEYTDGNLFVIFNQAYERPWLASYKDWGAWQQVYHADIIEDYFTDLQVLYEKVKDLVYMGGPNPGCYDEVLVSAFNEARNNAQYIIEGSATEEEYRVAYEALYAAWNSLRTASPFPFKAGLYKFRNWGSNYNTTKLMYAVPGQVKWTNWDGSQEAEFIWEAIDRFDGTYLLRNIGTGEFVSGSGKASSTGSPCIITSPDSTGQAVRFTNVGQGQFLINHKNTENLHAEWYENNQIGASNNVVSWMSEINSASAWYIDPIPSDSIEYWQAISKQLQLDRTLAELLAIAQNKYALGNAYDVDYDTPLLTAKEQILSNAAHMSTDPYTNEHGVWGTDQDGGGYPALIDNDSISFFHSAWGGTISEWHHLDFDLGQEQNAIALSYSVRFNNNNNFPTAYNIYAAKADADTSKIESWQLIRTFSDQPVDLNTVFHPGIELMDAYRYLRFEVTATKNNAKVNGYPFFALSAMQVYPATIKATCFNAVTPVALELNDMIKIASTVRPGETTQEDINQLQQAIDNYLAEFADPTALQQTVDSIRTNVLNRIITVDKEAEINGLQIYPDPGTWHPSQKQLLEETILRAENYLAEGSELGFYTKDNLQRLRDELLQTVGELARPRPFHYADSENQGTWYQIASCNRYFYANSNENKYNMRQGMIYIQDPEGQMENATLGWAPTDMLESNNIPAAYTEWRFVAMTDSTYAIQNRATGLYISHRTTHPATLSTTPVAFKINDIGYGAYTFKGYHLDGQPVDNNYLHAQSFGNLLVYWNNDAINSGSAWEIWNTEDYRTDEAGEPANDFIGEIRVEKFTRLEFGKLQAMCYPIDLRLTDDFTGDISPLYTIAAADAEKVTLVPATEVKAGTPFFYLAGNTQLSDTETSLFNSVQVSACIPCTPAIVGTPGSANGLIGNYRSEALPSDAHLLKHLNWESIDGIRHRLQVFSKASYFDELAFNSGYVLTDSIKNMEEIPSGSIVVYFDHAIDTTRIDTSLPERQALQATFDQASTYRMYIGTSTGQYTSPDFIDAYNHAYDMLTGSNNPVELSQADIRLQAAVDALQLNQPEAGKYYRFRSFLTGAYLYSDMDSDPLRLSTCINPANTKPNTFFLSDEGRLTGSLMLNLADTRFDHTGLGNSYTFTASGTDRTYFIRNEQGQLLCNVDSTLSVTNDSTDFTALWYIDEMTDSTQTPGYSFAALAHNDKCYQTLYAPVDLRIDASEFTNTVYTVQIQDDHALLTPIADGIIPAGTAVVVEYDTPFTPYPFINNIFYTIGGDRELTSDLQGSFVETPVEEGINYYTLQLINGQLGFFRYGGQTLNPYRAYLKLPASQQIKGFLIGDGQTTGIGTPSAGESTPVIYDLSGRRLKQIVQPGIYIINGKKIIVK